jgi:hypothetical protein
VWLFSFFRRQIHRHLQTLEGENDQVRQVVSWVENNMN